MSEIYIITVFFALLCLGTASGLTEDEEVLEAGLKKYYEIRKLAEDTLDEAYYFKINAKTAIAIGTADINSQVNVGISQELKPFRIALNKMLDDLRSNPAALNQCINTTYRTNVDYITDTAKFVDLPKNIADYYVNKYFNCANNSVETQKQLLQQIQSLELNLRNKFVENGTGPIRECSNGQTSQEVITSCIQNYLDQFSLAIDSVRNMFGDLLILDSTFIAIPVVFECAEIVGQDVGRSALNVVSAVRTCARKNGINIADPGLVFQQKYIYLPLLSEYSVNSVKALGIQSGISGVKLILERQTEDARRRLPSVLSSVTNEKKGRALTLYSPDPDLDNCIKKSQKILLDPIATGGRNGQCAQNYLNVVAKLQELYNETDILLKNTVSDESINIALCIAQNIYNFTHEGSCGQTLETKLQQLEEKRDVLLKSFDRFNINAIYSCPIFNTKTSVVTVNTTVYDDWKKEIYKCIFDKSI